MNKKLAFILPILLGLSACDRGSHLTLASQPSLDCNLSHLGPRVSSTAPASLIERRIEAKLSNPSESGLWEFTGTISPSDDGTKGSQVSGSFYQFDDGSFELVADVDTENIVVMPGNTILQDRGLQGVTFEEGGPVSTGIPLTATCMVANPASGDV